MQFLYTVSFYPSIEVALKEFFSRHNYYNVGRKSLFLEKAYIFVAVYTYTQQPVPVATRSKAYVCGRSPAEIVGSNPAEGMLLFVSSVVCCQVQVSATSWSLV